MPEFVCRYANDRGQVLKQVERAASEAEVRSRYAQQGLHIYSVKQHSGLGALIRTRPGTAKKIKLSEFVVFNQQFVTLIRAGLPIMKALELLSGNITKPALRTRVAEIREEVKGGALLSEAFKSQGVFPEVYTTSLLAGEKSGNLEEVVARYVTYQKSALTLKKKLLASMVYPGLLITAVLGLVTFLVTYVIPNFAELYRTLSQDLPPITQFLIGSTDAFKRYWFVFIGVVVLAVLGTWTWARSEKGGQTMDRIKRNLPLAGEIWVKYQVAQFCRILGTLLAGGIPLVQALETSHEAVPSPLLRQALTLAIRRVREGGTLYEGLRVTGFFPSLATEMVEVGESSGALPPMLSSVAEFFEEDVSTYLAALLSLVEPAILIFMGLLVAFILIALYLPIFSLAGKL